MKIPGGLARHALKLEKNSPTLLFGAGVVGSIASTVLACRATLKLEDVLAKAENNINIANSLEHREYSEQDRKRDKAVIYTRTVVEVGRLYAPAMIVGGLSIAALTKSHNILNDRITALSAAYAGLDRAFEAYRARVAEKYGEEAEHQIRFPREKVKETNPETGREHSVDIVSNLDASPYARFFDETSTSWDRDPEYNLLFLKSQQNWANDMLKMRGHVFLNEVYDSLGIPRSKAGAVVGWVVSKDGDNFVDFGIFDENDAVKRAFVNGHEKAILLDFNVDGIIYDRLSETAQEVFS